MKQQTSTAELLEQVNKVLSEKPLFYLSNDPERALGLEKFLKNYHIVHIDNNLYLPFFTESKIKFFCLENAIKKSNTVFRSSLRLLKHPEFLKYFEKHKGKENFLQTFKISPAFSSYAEKLGCKVLNTSAALNRMFEDKISQSNELAQLNISLPEYLIVNLSGTSFADLVKVLGTKLVVQFTRGHTGSGTEFINNEQDYQKLQNNFPNRPVRISKLITGDAYTINACVGKNAIYVGGLSYQLTGIPQLTSGQGSTVGNDFQYPENLEKDLKEKIISDIVKIGEHMRNKGYLGLFGVDLIVTEDVFKIVEINARQPASIPMFTKMQLLLKQVPLSLIHLAEFLNLSYNIPQESYNTAALVPQQFSQIFLRAQSDVSVTGEVSMGSYRLLGDGYTDNLINNDDSKKSQKVKSPGVIYLDEDRDLPLVFTKRVYAIDQVENGILLLPAAKGRLVKINQELARLQLCEGVLRQNKQLKPWVLKILIALKNYLL